jgi:DNA transposition AAA+ family ATPase
MAAAYAANQHRAYYIQCKSTWTKKALVVALLKEMGIQPKGSVTDMVEMACEELIHSGRPLIIDEVDHMVNKKAVEIIRDIYEGSEAPILLIGEEYLSNELEKWERFHSRILEWSAAQPVCLDDARQMRRLYSPRVIIEDDLLKHLLSLADGSVRRVCVNISQISKVAEAEGLESIDLDTWGSRPLYRGRPMKRDLKRRIAA